MNFIYFNGPEYDMPDLMKNRRACSICGKENGHCFALDYALANIFKDEEKEGKCRHCGKLRGNWDCD